MMIMFFSHEVCILIVGKTLLNALLNIWILQIEQKFFS